MKAFRNLKLAIALCHRYKVGLSLRLIPRDQGGYYGEGNPYITWCPFDKAAIPILFHEIGHHIDAKRHRTQYEIMSADVVYWKFFGTAKLRHRKMIDLLYEEANASQFALRAIKSLGLDEPNAKVYLWQAFTTYTNTFYRFFNEHEERMALTNLVNSCCMKILNR